MTDEFDISHADHDETQDIIDWAVRAAAMVILMNNSPAHSNTGEAMERLDGYIQAIKIMFENIPDVILIPAATVAQISFEEAIEEENAVEAFRAQLEDL